MAIIISLSSFLFLESVCVSDYMKKRLENQLNRYDKKGKK